MNPGISWVAWDADEVMYKGFSTSICARESPLDPKPYLERLIADGWFSYEDVGRWAKTAGKDSDNPIQTVGELADCLTKFLYEIRKPGTQEPVLSKERTIQAKQLILAGLTVGQVKGISDGIVYTLGVREAVEAFRDGFYTQTLFSDGLGPHIDYQVKKLQLDVGAGVPPIVSHGGKEFIYDYKCPNDAVLTGKIAPFDKVATFFERQRGYRKLMREVAAIDDSPANVPTLLVPVMEGGGIALGFNVKEANKPAFRNAKIPIIKGDSLGPFVEIVKDPRDSVIARYCE